MGSRIAAIAINRCGTSFDDPSSQNIAVTRPSCFLANFAHSYVLPTSPPSVHCKHALLLRCIGSVEEIRQVLSISDVARLSTSMANEMAMPWLACYATALAFVGKLHSGRCLSPPFVFCKFLSSYIVAL
jgi:hypothetical protein